MIEFHQENVFLSKLSGTIFYSSLITFLLLAALELAKRGFVSYHFNMTWLLAVVLASGTFYALFKNNK
ncbi:MAG: hypothetical protein PHW53_04365 [Patescibacteria group bacterium]|nr:hypothetical protein [Patescibacteria group bacterium]